MKQVAGQITLDDLLNRKKSIFGCEDCVCEKCLYRWSGRCPHGRCYDDLRARKNPYDKAHPGKPPRTLWSNWNKPGEQAHWCRGGIFYSVSYCKDFVKYQGSAVECCVDCNIQVFQDGYISCSIKDSIGCDACIERAEGRERERIYGCPYMTETGCEAHINALTLMAHLILNEGLKNEMCGKQCCIGCTKACGFRCGAAS